jgi:hypothetical protein
MVLVDHHEYLCEEEKRLKEDRERKKYWKKWGPYVAERQWATGTYSNQIHIPPQAYRVLSSERGLFVSCVILFDSTWD